MSVVSFHPAEILDRLRAGTETAEDRQHVASCAACRLLAEVAAEFAGDAAVRAGDHAWLEAQVDKVLARVPGLSPDEAFVPAARTTRASRPRARTTWLLAAAVLALTAIATATGIWLGRRSMTARTTTPPLPRAPIAASVVPAGPLAEPARGTEPTVIANAADLTVPQAAARLVPAIDAPPRRTAASQGGVPPTAADLFRRANDARRQGALADATAGYEALQREYPASREALQSRVSFGRMLLDRTGNGREALAQFNAYLALAPDGNNREEALIGRALALGRLGRRAEERESWRELLRDYPDSIYSERARDRLGNAP